MYTLDTNACIYYVHGEESVRRFLDDAVGSGAPFYISAVTITELLRFPRLSTEEENSILSLLPGFSAIALDSHIARSAGFLGRTHNLKLADSIIAATALFTGTTLVTRNIRDFKRVPNLFVEKI